tara:strand:+ start:380 stop:586 length:207 start_codon:yes stop_codon:yes gene_type:complete
MKIGDLVKTKRAMLGIPIGSHGIIIKTKVTGEVWIHVVQLFGSKFVAARVWGAGVGRSFLSRDLEVVA